MVKQCNPKAKIITIVVVVVLILAIVALSVLAIIDNAYSSPNAISATRLYGYIMYPQVRLLSTSVSDNGNPFDLGYSQYNMLVSGAYLPADMSSADIDIYSQQVQYDMRAGSYSIVAGQDTLDMWQSTALRQSVFLDGDAISIDSSVTGSYNAYFAVSSEQGLDSLYAIGNDAWDIHYMGITWLCYLSSDNSNSIAIGVPLDYLRDEGDTLIDSYDAVDTFGEVLEHADSFGSAGDAVLDSSFANCDQLDLAEQMQTAAQYDQLIGFCVRGSYDDIAPFLGNFILVQLDPAI